MVSRRTYLPLLAVVAVALPLVLLQAVTPVAAQDDPNAAASIPDRPRIDTPDPETGAIPGAGVGFATLELTLDPKGKRLAAYQIEVRVIDAGTASTSADAPANPGRSGAGGSFKVVGLESSTDPAFDRAPYYDLDTRNTATDRLILAQYSTADRSDLPTTTINLATAHLAIQLSDDAAALPKLQVTVTAAYDDAGKPIDATASYRLTTPAIPGEAE